MDTYLIVEKKNPLAVHGIFYSYESAEKHLKNVIPLYVSRGYFIDKTLTTNSFEIRKKDHAIIKRTN